MIITLTNDEVYSALLEAANKATENLHCFDEDSTYWLDVDMDDDGVVKSITFSIET